MSCKWVIISFHLRKGKGDSALSSLPFRTGSHGFMRALHSHKSLHLAELHHGFKTSIVSFNISDVFEISSEGSISQLSTGDFAPPVTWHCFPPRWALVDITGLPVGAVSVRSIAPSQALALRGPQRGTALRNVRFLFPTSGSCRGSRLWNGMQFVLPALSFLFLLLSFFFL